MTMRMRVSALLVAAAVAGFATAAPAQPPMTAGEGRSVPTWRVTIDGDPRARTFAVEGGLPADDQPLPKARYGYADGRGSPVRAELRTVGGQRQLLLVTPADSRIVATANATGGFDGTFVTKGGSVKAVTMTRIDASLQAEPAAPTAAPAPTGKAPPDIHIVYMGGNDCPPCRAWRGTELPKLQASAVFRQARFSHVEKAIHSTVPPLAFLPDAVKPYKQQLDAASGGHGGSAQVAVLVDGGVHDYYYGSRSATDIEAMIRAISDGTRYPFRRCVRRGPLQNSCDAWG